SLLHCSCLHESTYARGPVISGSLLVWPAGVAECLLLHLLTELGRLGCFVRQPFAPLDVRPARALRSEAVARIGLHANEIVVAGQLEEAFADARVELDRMVTRCRPILVLQIRQRQRDTGRDMGLGADGGPA